MLPQNVFPLFPCNWLAILFPKLYHGRKPVSSFSEFLLCALQHSVDIAVTHSARRILTELRSSALNADAPQAPYDVARTEARTFNSGGPGDAGRGVSALQC